MMAARLVTILYGVLSISAPAQNFQNFDSSGNGTVKGAYFVRQVLLANLDQTTSAIGRAIGILGTMTFDGNGNYSFTGQWTDTQPGGSVLLYTTQGGYAVASNGLIAIQSPIDNSVYEFGGVGAAGPAAIVASSTEGPYSDVFVAIPAGSGVSNGSVQGTYQVAFIDFLQANASQVRDGYYTLTANGFGSFGNVTVNGAMANQGSNNVQQTLAGVTYTITNSNGIGTITFPTSSSPLSALVSGPKAFYLSADGNLLVGGSTTGFDLMVGIRSVSGSGPDLNSRYQGTYYTGALENDASDLSNGNNNIDSFYGSTLSLGQGTAISHLRLLFFNGGGAFDQTSDSTYSFGSDGTQQKAALEYLLGANGQAILKTGRGNQYTLIVSLRAMQNSATGVFLDPLKIWNAAGFAPITNSVAPGEYVSLFGTGLSPVVLQAQSFPLPTNLGGVQVTVNGRLAPLSYVSPTQINLLIPYATSEAYVYFQVNNNGVQSNAVMVNPSATAPGVFALTQNGGSFPPGVGPAAVLHADYTLVTPSNPARAGETLQLYVTGLGAVTPAVGDGAAAPSSPLSMVNDPNVIVELEDQNFNFYSTALGFAGLAPGFAGLYQINFTVPRGAPAGLVWVNVGTSEAYTTEAKLYVR